MKKILSYLIMAFAVIAMSSCDRDAEISAMLSGGVWEGEVVTEFFSGRYGHTVEYQDVDIEFYDDNGLYRGSGMEYDYITRNRYTSCSFEYEVYSGNIYIDYNDGTHVVIGNYHLTETHFTGTFYRYNGPRKRGEKIADFNFTRYTSWRHVRH